MSFETQKLQVTLLFLIMLIGLSCKKKDPLPKDITDQQLSVCDQIKSLKSNQEFINKFIELYNDSKTKIRETGYVFKWGKNNSTYSKIEGRDGESGIDVTLNDPVDGYIHSHYGNLFPIFSGSDIKSIYDAYLIDKINHLNNFTVGVVTASETTYLLKTIDFDQFIRYSKMNFDQDADFRKFETDYNNLVIAFSNYGRNTAFEMALVKMLENSGLKLYKGNLNFNSWSEMSLNASGKIDLKICN